MKEIKDIQLKVRVTSREKEEIQEYCEAHKMTISDFLRVAANNLLKERV